ncbi:MAG: DNA gyrase inhibitor YacG [Pirellulales bacterium]|nr:DNA gyrase inhibitor YacG [Pirellulales bacterium]
MLSSICPTCGRAFDPDNAPSMPFCCERCRLIDLGRWLAEEYTVPISNSMRVKDESGNDGEKWPTD